MVDEISDIYNVLKPKLFDEGLKKGIGGNDYWLLITFCLHFTNIFFVAFALFYLL